MLEHSLLDEPKQALAPTVTTPAVPVGFAKQHYTTIDPYLENCTTDGTDYCNGMTHTSPSIPHRHPSQSLPIFLSPLLYVASCLRSSPLVSTVRSPLACPKPAYGEGSPRTKSKARAAAFFGGKQSSGFRDETERIRRPTTKAFSPSRLPLPALPLPLPPVLATDTKWRVPAMSPSRMRRSRSSRYM